MPRHALDFREPGARHRRAPSRNDATAPACGVAPMPAISSSGEPRIALLAAGAMRADRKPVRLVAQALQEIEHRVARLEREGRPARAERTARARHCGRVPWRCRRPRTSSMPSSAKIACAGVSWPWPPSISTRSGHCRARARDPPSARGRSGGGTPRASSRNRRRRTAFTLRSVAE